MLLYVIKNSLQQIIRERVKFNITVNKNLDLICLFFDIFSSKLKKTK